jgi:glycosyltransferase involved in cell wall biosynthesis
MKTSPQVSPAELAVVMPVYNEAANISAVLHEWFDYLSIVAPNFVLFAVNDGSKDRTAEILGSLRNELGPRLRVVNKSNSGHGLACRDGYELALRQGSPWIFQIDSDGQCDPVFFETLYRDRAQYDCIFGYRRTRDDGIGRCRFLLWLVTGTNLPDPNVPYRLMRSSALRKALRKVTADFELQNIGLAFALKQQPELAWKYFPIHFRARRGGENSINYRTIAKMGINLPRDLRRLTHEDSHPRWRPSWARRRLAS